MPTMVETAETATMEATPAQLQAQLEQLKASATQQYSLKNYSAAAEFYSEAAEVQDQVNGEMSPENSDLLYQYGRCLYHLGVSKSDVLGGKVAGNNNGSEEPKRKKRKTAAPVAESGALGGESTIADALKNGEQKLAEVKEEGDEVKTEQQPSSSKPFFQITGDENWTDSEGEDDDEDAGENGEGDEEEEEDDDFAIAYEILDVARVLLGRKLESLDASSPEARQVKERLADTHDLQAEIKLENEQFADAVTDAKAALSFKLQLYPQESGLIAEAHYKLAIALDFASLPVSSAEEEEENSKASTSAPPKEEPKVNEEMRSEAATEMEKAIASCQKRIQTLEASSGKKTAASTIADVKSMISEMKNRLVDLRSSPSQVLTAAAAAAPAEAAPDGSDPLRGVLGAMLGASKAEQAKRIQEATSQANDLSGLVKKRKAKAVEDVAAGEGEGKGKKAKVEE